MKNPIKILKYETSLKTKFFLSMSTLTTFVITLLFLVMSIIFYYNFFSAQAESSSLQLNAINKQINFYLTSMDNYSRMMISDTNIQKNIMLYENNKHTFTEKNRSALRAEMRKFIQTIPYIHSTTIYATDYTCITSTAVNVYPVPLSNLNIRNQTIYATTEKYSNFNINQKIPCLSLLRPFYEISTGKKLGYIEITIAESDIAALYSSNTSETSKLFITDSSGKVVSTDGTYMLNTIFTPIQNNKESFATQFYSNHGSICFISHIKPLNWFIVNEVKLTTFFQPLYLILLITVIICVLFLTLSMIISRKISETITKPLYHLISHIQKVKQGHWLPLNNTPEDVDFHLLFQEFDSMLLSQEKLTNDLIIAQKAKDTLSLNLLQQQVKPHFLYNTLDNIASLAELDETDILLQLVRNLSEFYRHSLSDGNFIISISNELELTQAYVNIMQIRYVNKFSFTINCPNSLRSYSCLKLLLQPVIENSIYHGIKEANSFGHITVDVTLLDSDIQFIIEDNGPGITEPSFLYGNIPEEGHFGIRSIQKRIQMYYGAPYGLSMKNLPNGGLKTIILIPKKELE